MTVTIIVAAIMMLVRLEDRGMLSISIRKYVTTSEDLAYLSKLGQKIIVKEEEVVPVSSDVGQTELLSFENAEVFQNGFLLKYNVGIPIYAGQEGLVVFTGHKKHTGKSMTVSYEDGTVVTYGNLDKLSQLPYTSVQQGHVIGMKNAGQLFIAIEKNDKAFSLEQIIEWLKSNTITYEN